MCHEAFSVMSLGDRICISAEGLGQEKVDRITQRVEIHVAWLGLDLVSWVTHASCFNLFTCKNSQTIDRYSL